MSEQEAKADPPKEEEAAEGDDGAPPKEEESTATFEPVVCDVHVSSMDFGVSLLAVESTGFWYQG